MHPALVFLFFAISLAAAAGSAEQVTLVGDAGNAYFVAEFNAHNMFSLGKGPTPDDPFSEVDETNPFGFPQISNRGLVEVFGSSRLFDIGELFKDKGIDLEGGVAVYSLSDELIFVRGSIADVELVEAYLSPMGPDPPVNIAIRFDLIGVDEAAMPSSEGRGVSPDPAVFAGLKPEARELLFSQTVLTGSGQRSKLSSGWDLIEHPQVSEEERDDLPFLDRVKSGGEIVIDPVLGPSRNHVHVITEIEVKLPAAGGGIGYAERLSFSATLVGDSPVIVQDGGWGGREGWRVYSVLHAELRRPSGEPNFVPVSRLEEKIRAWREKGANFIAAPLAEK